jgi:hypothetical protein
VRCTYDTRYEWMVAVRDATERGISQRSQYTQIVATHGDVAVQANFCAIGSHCGVKTSLPSGPSSGGSDTLELIYYPTCETSARQQVPGPESGVLAQFMEDVGQVHFQNMASVTLASGAGQVSDNPRCRSLP